MQEEDAPAIGSAEDLVRFRETLHVEILKYSHGTSDAERELARKQHRTSLLTTLDERGPSRYIHRPSQHSTGEEDAQFLTRLGDDVQPDVEGFGARYLVRAIARLVHVNCNPTYSDFGGASAQPCRRCDSSS